jgi:hypothetical protein
MPHTLDRGSVSAPRCALEDWTILPVWVAPALAGAVAAVNPTPLRVGQPVNGPMLGKHWPVPRGRPPRHRTAHRLKPAEACATQMSNRKSNVALRTRACSVHPRVNAFSLRPQMAWDVEVSRNAIWGHFDPGPSLASSRNCGDLELSLRPSSSRVPEILASRGRGFPKRGSPP